jgi:hypothetical protein
MLADSAPQLDTDSYYAIAVYHIATPKRWSIESELKGIAALKRKGQKDIKPSRAIVLRKEGTFATASRLISHSLELASKSYLRPLNQILASEFLREIAQLLPPNWEIALTRSSSPHRYSRGEEKAPLPLVTAL